MARSEREEQASERGAVDPGLPGLAILVTLFLVVVWRVASSWRYFDRFLGDDGWVLRVAQRVAAGELLYRDVGWDYGPLPIYSLGFLLRLSPSVVWFSLLDILLSSSAVFAVYVASRSVFTGWASLVVTSWAALLGSSASLISHQLDAYTSPVAWGTATSLAAAAAGCVWVQKRSLPALLATCLFALLAVLSKPEYGLAGLGALATALCLHRPSKRFGLAVLGLASGLIVLVVLLVHPATLATIWRGYSGYDLIAAGSVIIFAWERLFGSLLVAAAVGAFLWWTTRTRSFVAVVTLIAAFIVVLRVTEGDRYLHAGGIIAQVSWVGVCPGLVWLGWKARNATMPPVFWILWAYSLTVNLRWLFIGSFTPAAAGPVAILFWLLAKHRVLHRPTRAGWLVVAAFLLFSSVAPQLRSLRIPSPLHPVATTLGTVRLPASVARNIESVREALEAAPAGGLFVSGGGPGWYLVSDRSNPTRFDVVYPGIGTTEPEVTELLQDLRSDPPAIILFEHDFRNAGDLSPGKIAATIGLTESPAMTTPDGRWTLYVMTASPSDP